MAQKLDENAVLHVAGLARLTVTPEECRAYADQLSRILDYVGQLNELDTADVPHTAHPLGLTDVWRDDEVGECLPQSAALANAPQSHNGFFQLPRVLDQESS